MINFLKGREIPQSRHPHILYWYWNQETVTDKKYLRDLELVAKTSPFTMIAMTARDLIDFWKPEMKPMFDEAVAYAHELGLKIIIQLWPQGFITPALEEVPLEEAFAMLDEGECFVRGGTAIFRDDSHNVCKPHMAPVIHTELVHAWAFRKASDGVYFDGTLVDVTDRAEVVSLSNGHIELRFDLPELEDCAVYVMVAHYHRFGDLFSDYYIRQYGKFMEDYRDTPFDGVVLDEMKNLEYTMGNVIIRERIYGKHFKQYFEAETGEDCDRILFEMRYTAMSEQYKRPRAINLFYDIIRRATRRLEQFTAEKAQEVYGEETFLGLHNTYHNHLQNDELLSTGINWWEVPRKYAQSDEDITYPVRMGMACQCPEALVYDMFYAKSHEPFLEKVLRDAKFGCRIHYHAMNDGYWGINAGSPEFIDDIRDIEQKIDLLNVFDPVMPKMDLLVVFGFPALCNWYPDIRARNNMDLNGSLRIMERVDALWKAGYLNALAPDDALHDGRITVTERGTFSYCGHEFAHMLYLYPEYSKKETLAFLKNAIGQGTSLSVIGPLTTDFTGAPVSRELRRIIEGVTVGEAADIPALFGLCANPLDAGCYLEDGSAVFSDRMSLEKHEKKTFRAELCGHVWSGEYEGTAAIRADSTGELRRFVAGNCTKLEKDGEILFESDEGTDLAYLG